LSRVAAAILGRYEGRHWAARTYISGHGIEVGALHFPTRLPAGARVRYVDRLDEDALRVQYPELKDERLVHVDLIDDGQRLSKVPDASEDFVIANHLLEHAEDPIGMIGNMMRVLRPKGVLMLAVPDKRFTFDADRPVTSWQHLVEDHADGGAAARDAHFREWVELVDDMHGARGEQQLAWLLETDHSTHFHVWTYQEMLEIMLILRGTIGFEIELVMRRGIEVVFVLRKGFEESDPQARPKASTATRDAG